jgi:hypothetical protein
MERNLAPKILVEELKQFRPFKKAVLAIQLKISGIRGFRNLRQESTPIADSCPSDLRVHQLVRPVTMHHAAGPLNG